MDLSEEHKNLPWSGVMVVDASIAVRRALSEYFEPLVGYVDAFRNHDQSTDAARRRPPDVVVVDPDMEGFAILAFLESLRALKCPRPANIVLYRSAPGAPLPDLSAHAIDFVLPKDRGVRPLARAVQLLIERRRSKWGAECGDCGSEGPAACISSAVLHASQVARANQVTMPIRRPKIEQGSGARPSPSRSPSLADVVSVREPDGSTVPIGGASLGDRRGRSGDR